MQTSPATVLVQVVASNLSNYISRADFLEIGISKTIAPFTSQNDLESEQSFRFPPADLSMATSMQLQRLSMKSDGDIDDISATSASAIASWVHALFKQIGGTLTNAKEPKR
eukprot:6345294-Amphidinium_carterae.1